jgi:hypothetical protein
MGGGHAKVVLGSPLHSIAMHGAVYRVSNFTFNTICMVNLKV